MNYRKGFRRLGAVLSLGALAFWAVIAAYGLYWEWKADPDHYNQWDVFIRSFALFGVVPIASYWLLYWLISWIVVGFRTEEEHR